MKKIYIAFLILISSLCILSMTSFAQPYIITGLDETNKVSVNIVTDSDEKSEYMLYILKPEVDVNTFSDTENGAWKGLYKMEKLTESTKVNDNYNVYTYEFTAKSDDSAGEYTVIVAGNGFDKLKERTVSYVKASNATAFTELNMATASTVKEILEKYNQTVWSVDFNNSIYKLNPQKVLANFASVCNAIKSDADVQKAFLISCALVEFENSQDSSVFDELEKYEYLFGIEYGDGVKTKQSDFTTSLNYIIKNDNPSLKNVSELALLLKSAEALNAVNSADRDNILAVIEKYSDVFDGIKLDELAEYIDRYSLAKELVAQVGGYTSIGAVESTYQSAVIKLGSAVINSSRPSSSGGGSGGGISVGGITVPSSVNQDTVNNLSPYESIGTFKDVEEGHWAEAYIDYLNYNKIMTGDGEGSFRPNDSITREEFLKVLVSAFDLQMPIVGEDEAISFEDVPEDVWYYESINIAYHLGISNGITQTSFGVGIPITRQDAAVLIDRVRNIKELSFSDIIDTAIFADEDFISSYAKDSVKVLQKAQVLNGYEDGTFKPSDSITRAEAAKVVYAVLNKLGLLR